MLSRWIFVSFLSVFAWSTNAQNSFTIAQNSSTSASASASGTKPSPTNSFPKSRSRGPPDVVLNVPKLHVGRIDLSVDHLTADINLNARIAQFVTLNVGIQVNIKKVNLSITDVDTNLSLVVRLDQLANIVNRVFKSLDLNPSLISASNNVTSILSDNANKPGVVEGLLGSITQNGKTINFLVDNIGNIVQQVVDEAGQAVNTIVGNYELNMTYTGQQLTLPNGSIQKTFSYTPLNSIVDITFTPSGQVIQANVHKRKSGGGGQTPINQPNTAQPNTAQPKTNQPNGNEPNVNKPVANQPNPAQPKNAAPKSNQPSNSANEPKRQTDKPTLNVPQGQPIAPTSSVLANTALPSTGQPSGNSVGVTASPPTSAQPP